MKKEKTNNYYTNQDLINFEKLDNFKELKFNKLKNKQIKAHPFRYATSDDKHFNKIMNNNDNSTSENLEKKIIKVIIILLILKILQKLINLQFLIKIRIQIKFLMILQKQ